MPEQAQISFCVYILFHSCALFQLTVGVCVVLTFSLVSVFVCPPSFINALKPPLTAHKLVILVGPWKKATAAASF